MILCDFVLQTIGHDPYANSATSKIEADIDNEQTKGILLLARLKNVKNGNVLKFRAPIIKVLCGYYLGNEARGGCTKCGMLGHLTFQCRNEPLNKNKEEVNSEVSDMF